MRLDRTSARALLVPVAAIMLAAAGTQLSLFPRVQWWAEDALQRRSGDALALEHVVVVDVDEESMQRLQPVLGTWPYERRVYAEVARYLAAAGARAVAYDILFAEPRAGDEELAAALGPGSVLAAAALQSHAPRSPDFLALLDRLSPPALRAPREGRVPARAWPDLTLPLPVLFSRPGVGVGVISALPDADGVIRRLHLTHEAYGRTLPSLPLATVLAYEGTRTLSQEGSRFRFGEHAWPASANGEVRLRFPSNARALPVVPFHQLVRAARGAPDTAHLRDALKDKAVFVGSSSAVLGDVVLTPVGPLPGVQLGGLVAEMLLAGHVLGNPRPGLDLALLAAALAPALALLARRRVPGAWPILAALAATALAAAGGGLALLATGVQSHWLFAGLAGLLALGIAALAWIVDLHRERLRLHFEKLAAESANRMKTEFLNRMTHELRTPLTAIMGFNKINRYTDALGREQRLRNAEAIARNCDHLLALVNENLDLARIEAGRLEIARAPADPVALADEVVSALRGADADAEARLALRVDGTLPALLAIDATRVRQVLFNLAGNALSHAGNAPVEVCAAWTDGDLRLAVADRGPGLPDAVRARLFEPFARGAGGGGTGLGLAITRRLVEAMGGAIEVASAPGAGTRIVVRLPAAPVAAAAMPAAATAPRRRLAGDVLVAEDHRDLRALLAFQMKEIGPRCTAVADGLEAVEALDARAYDLVVLDLEMPRMDGYEAARVLRARGFRGPIVALTAHDQPAETGRALAEGCTRVLGKPIRLEPLHDALAEFLPPSGDAPAEAAPDAALEVDARIADLYAGFVATARTDLGAALQALARGEFEAARIAGHALKGSSASYGIPEAGRIGGLLELAARAGDEASVRRLAARLEALLADAGRAAAATPGG